MRNTIMSGVRQSVRSARFWLGAVFIAAAVFLASMDGVLEALRSEDPLAAGFHGDLVVKAMSADAIVICLPIVCALPYAASYVDEVKTGFIKLYIHRTSQRAYILGKVAGCLVSGGLVMVAGLWLAYGASALVFLPLEAAPKPGEETPAYAVELANACGPVFLSGGFWALFGMTMSSLMESRYIAYASPFIFYYICIILCERYFSWLYVIYPKAWLSAEGWQGGRWGAAAVLGELICLAALAFGASVRKRVREL